MKFDERVMRVFVGTIISIAENGFESGFEEICNVYEKVAIVSSGICVGRVSMAALAGSYCAR